MQTRTLLSTVSIALVTLTAAGPAFAFMMSPDQERPVRRTLMELGKNKPTVSPDSIYTGDFRVSNHKIVALGRQDRRVRAEAEQPSNAILSMQVLRTGQRNLNRHLLGERRGEYRVLNTNGDDRRSAGPLYASSFDSLLPPTLVRTGFDGEGEYDRPTRRDIRGDRDRNFVMRR